MYTAADLQIIARELARTGGNRARAAQNLRRERVCPFSPHCKTFHESHRQVKSKKTIFDLLTNEQQDQFVNEG